MASAPEPILPDFKSAPIEEVALAVQVPPNVVDVLQAALFHNRIKSEFPNRQSHPAKPPMAEDFTVESQPPVRIELIQPTAMPRFWFVSLDDALLVQLQHDLLAVNWRKRPSGVPYPHYDWMRKFLADQLGVLQEVLDGTKLQPNWCEITYVNQIPPKDGSRPPIGALLEGVDIPRDDGFLPQPEDAAIALRFVIREQETRRGRLNVNAQSATRNADLVPVWVLNLTARVLADDTGGIDSAIEAIDVGHEWVARAFGELTSADLQERWQTDIEEE